MYDLDDGAIDACAHNKMQTVYLTVDDPARCMIWMMVRSMHVHTTKCKLSTLRVDDLARCMIWMMVLSMHAHITKCKLFTSPVDDLARCLIGNDGAIDACAHNKM